MDIKEIQESIDKIIYIKNGIVNMDWQEFLDCLEFYGRDETIKIISEKVYFDLNQNKSPKK